MPGEAEGCSGLAVRPIEFGGGGPRDRRVNKRRELCSSYSFAEA